MRVRFGPYEIDTAAAELRKHGLRVQLQEQPFRILTALLERPGELVSRDDLIRRLWGDGTHVDYDRGLNAAVTRLRQALADAADRPRYVETVARRGYRFIAPVEGLMEPAAVSPAPPHRGPAKRHLVWILTACAAIAAVPIAFLLTRRESPLPPPHVTPLTSYTGLETEPSFSPDGSQVAFSWNGEAQTNFDIYVQTVGSSAPLRLTTGGAADRSPAWSPDGRSIAFWRDGQGIFLVSPTGGAERRLIASSNASGQISWSADSRHIVFATGTAESNERGMFAVTAEGSRARRLIAPEPAAHLRDPAISPDGRWLAYAHCYGTPNCDLAMAEVDAQLNIVSPARSLASKIIQLRGIAWTPDSSAILFSQGPDWGYPGQRLWRVGTRPGASPQLLSYAPARTGFPAISRAGSRLVYSTRVGDPDLYRIENGVFSRSALSSTQLDMSAEFSPDGRRVAFASPRSGTPEIWVADAEGPNSIRLTFSRMSGSPRWSPDGKWIVYDTQVSGANWDIHIVNAAGGQSTPVVRHPSLDYGPSFSRDGKWIYFASNRGGTEDVYRVAVDGGSPERLTNGGGGPALESADGKSVYFLKSEGEPGAGCHSLFELRMPEGPARKVAEAVCNRAFVVTLQGIYYVTGRLDGGAFKVQLLEAPSGRVRTLASSNDRFYLAQGLTVSPDGRVLLLAGSYQSGADLYLVENFR